MEVLLLSHKLSGLRLQISWCNIMIFMVMLTCSVAMLKCYYNHRSATCTLNSSIASLVLNDMLLPLWSSITSVEMDTHRCVQLEHLH